jgi:hypothetical protein
MYLTCISVSCSLVASCKQGYEFNISKHGDRNEFNLISTYRNYKFCLYCSRKGWREIQGRRKADIGVHRKRLYQIFILKSNGCTIKYSKKMLKFTLKCSYLFRFKQPSSGSVTFVLR